MGNQLDTEHVPKPVVKLTLQPDSSSTVESHSEPVAKSFDELSPEELFDFFGDFPEYGCCVCNRDLRNPSALKKHSRRCRP
mgnify:CR=1 FL=1